MTKNLSFAAFLTIILHVAIPARGQEQSHVVTLNPLDEIQETLKRILSDAGLPFTAEQEKSITLVLEESRRASEDLFGDLMNFKDGPPDADQRDRTAAGIQWMNDDFSRRVSKYLSAEQLAAWRSYSDAPPIGKPIDRSKQQVQQIRINNNPFSSENSFQGGNTLGSFGYFGGGSAPRTEIIPRGGFGTFHGNLNFSFRDESLNARNPFASNRPAFQQRNISASASGPVIRDRLTLSFGGSQSEMENGDTIHAETAEGVFELGITHPVIKRAVFTKGIYQLTEEQSLQFDLSYGRNLNKNRGIGGLNLPERASNGRNWWEQLNLRHIWMMSSRTIQDLSLSFYKDGGMQIPVTDAVTVNVLGAFSSGGAQDKDENKSRNYSLHDLVIYTGTRWSIRSGGGIRRWGVTDHSERNFLGSFTFSDIDSYLAGDPINFRVTRGDPLLAVVQTDWNGFWQSDLRLSNRSTLLFGLRYEDQSNLADRNNFDPRFAVAHALGNSTVLRAGIGMFHEQLYDWIVQEVRRLDGIRQYELVVSNPSYPDPFLSGNSQIVPPSSRRTWAPRLVAPYNVQSSAAVERTLPHNLFFSVSYDYQRGIHQLRSRNLNAPLPMNYERPDPLQGDIWQLESSGLQYWSDVRITMRQRFSIFSVNAGYTRQWGKNDTDGPFSTPSDNYNLRLDWGRIAQPAQKFDADVNSRLPLGILLAANISLSGAATYNITTGRDDNGDGITNDRPPGVPRNSGNGPGLRNVDFRITKTFRFGSIPPEGGGTNLNIFANMYNAFNSTHLGTPNGVLTAKDSAGNSLFGKPFSADNPRQIEVGLRFQF